MEDSEIRREHREPDEPTDSAPAEPLSVAESVAEEGVATRDSARTPPALETHVSEAAAISTPPIEAAPAAAIPDSWRVDLPSTAEPSWALGVCPLCGRIVEPWQRRCICGAHAVDAADADEMEKPMGFDYGALTPWVLVGATVIIVGFVVPLSSAEFPGTRLLKISLMTVIATSMLALLTSARVEGKAWKMPDSAWTSFTPVTWFFLLLVGWPILLPLFFYVHYFHHNRVRMGFAWTAHLLFLLVVAYAWPRELVIVSLPITAQPPPVTKAPSRIVSAPDRSPPAAVPVAPEPTPELPLDSPLLPPTDITQFLQPSSTPQVVYGRMVDNPVAPTAQSPQTSAGSGPGPESMFGYSVPKKRGER